MNQAMHKFEAYQEIFHELKTKYKWSFSDNRILMMAASLYVANEKEFNLKRYDEIVEYIKGEVGLFSTLKGNDRFTFAAMLDTKFDDSKAAFKEFIQTYDSVIEAGFHRSTFSYIAAMVALTGEKDASDAIPRSYDIYKSMKSNHFFFTGMDDYPLAMLLAQRELEKDAMMAEIESFYQKLNEAGFRKSNELQSMSHILSLEGKTNPDTLVSRCQEMFSLMKESGLKPKAMHYPHIALLAFLDQAKVNLHQVVDIFDQLNAEKDFKWQKDFNLVMAIQLLIAEKVGESTVLSTALHSTIQALIQAQQAACIAAVSGATAAASTAGA
ncbi:uncharacterized protein DUF4003 [Falsibacillus pallidus]|uniref:Uncharacterized protein DUF4003 n=2 Tax=Falsibacillus pallidus TaxID=493781 RepID=A0A370G7Q0_9BACI|nr:uncharacterized protein DUF4003 [Falsibacillus pallidus]